MKFGGIIGRGKKREESLPEDEELASDGDESFGEDEPFDESWASIDLDVADLKVDEDAEEPSARIEEQAAETGSGNPANLTSHTRNRLSALDAFEKIYGSAESYLHDISSKLAAIRTLHGSVGELITILHSEIHRANELELANMMLLKEHRKVWEQLQDSNRKHQEREHALERLQRRETVLVQDVEALRAELGTAKFELIEASNASSTHDAELGELTKTLSTRTLEGERRARENDALREKNVTLSIELDKAIKKEAECRHKLDELARVHSGETARGTELRSALLKSESEILKLQKTLDGAVSRQAQMQQRADALEADREAEIQRGAAEFRGLRSEIQTLQSRLEAALSENGVSISEITQLRAQLLDVIAEREAVDERLAALSKEYDADKRDLATAYANLSEFTLRQTSEQMQLEVRIQECEDLRAEIAVLNAQISELLPYERLHRVTQARQKETAGSVVDFTNAALDSKRNQGRRPAGSGRGPAR